MFSTILQICEAATHGTRDGSRFSAGVGDLVRDLGPVVDHDQFTILSK